MLDHYGLDSSRIQPGKPHENGVAEQAHFRTKTAIEQALLLRGDRDFVDESSHLCFVRAVVDEERNRPAAARLAEERLYLRPLPAARIPEYTTFQCRVLQVEHVSHRQPDLLGAVAVDRSHGRSAPASFDGRAASAAGRCWPSCGTSTGCPSRTPVG